MNFRQQRHCKNEIEKKFRRNKNNVKNLNISYDEWKF